MDTQIILEIAQRTLAGTISFPEVVKNLLSAGVEYYHVDYIRLQKTFYGGAGEVVVTPIKLEALPAVAANFDTATLKAAILDSQKNDQKFRDFSARAIRSGVHGYYAFLRGQRVTYFSREGEQHTEWFPGTRPVAD